MGRLFYLAFGLGNQVVWESPEFLLPGISKTTVNTILSRPAERFRPREGCLPYLSAVVSGSKCTRSPISIREDNQRCPMNFGYSSHGVTTSGLRQSQRDFTPTAYNTLMCFDQRGTSSSWRNSIFGGSQLMHPRLLKRPEFIGKRHPRVRSPFLSPTDVRLESVIVTRIACNCDHSDNVIINVSVPGSAWHVRVNFAFIRSNVCKV